MFCPNCGSEYRDEIWKCAKCDVALVRELPRAVQVEVEHSAETVVVFESTVPGESEMVLSALEEAGIVGQIQRKLAGGLRLGFLEGGLTPGQGYAVLVPQLGEKAAREVVESIRPENPAAFQTERLGSDTDGDELAPAPNRGTKLVARVILAFFLAPLLILALAMIVALVQRLS